MSRRAWMMVLLSLCLGCASRIQHGLDERQANELTAALADRGIVAQKVLEPGKRPTWALEVDEEQAADAVRLLAELGLPRARNDGFEDVFGKGSLVPSPTEERALYLQALSGEVARTLESLDGVVSARVHLVLPQPPHGGQPAAPTKGSALVRVRPGQLERLAQSRGELRSLIAGAAEGLSPDNVTLVLEEVSTRVEGRQGPSPRATRLRCLALTLGLIASLLGGALGALLLKLRRTQAELQLSRAASSSARSASGSHSQPRKAA